MTYRITIERVSGRISKYEGDYTVVGNHVEIRHFPNGHGDRNWEDVMIPMEQIVELRAVLCIKQIKVPTL